MTTENIIITISLLLLKDHFIPFILRIAQICRVCTCIIDTGTLYLCIKHWNS